MAEMSALIIAFVFTLGLDMIGLYVKTQQECHDYRIAEKWVVLALGRLFRVLVVCWGSTCWHTTLPILSSPEARPSHSFRARRQEIRQAPSFES